jgi:hypothetical protein
MFEEFGQNSLGKLTDAFNIKRVIGRCPGYNVID